MTDRSFKNGATTAEACCHPPPRDPQKFDAQKCHRCGRRAEWRRMSEATLGRRRCYEDQVRLDLRTPESCAALLWQTSRTPLEYGWKHEMLCGVWLAFERGHEKVTRVESWKSWSKTKDLFGIDLVATTKDGHMGCQTKGKLRQTDDAQVSKFVEGCREFDLDVGCWLSIAKGGLTKTGRKTLYDAGGRFIGHRQMDRTFNGEYLFSRCGGFDPRNWRTVDQWRTNRNRDGDVWIETQDSNGVWRRATETSTLW